MLRRSTRRPGHLRRQAPVGDDDSQRQGQPGRPLPLRTEVGQQKEPVTAIDETSLVYQHPRIALTPPDDVRNIGEEIGPFVGKVRK